MRTFAALFIIVIVGVGCGADRTTDKGESCLCAGDTGRDAADAATVDSDTGD